MPLIAHVLSSNVVPLGLQWLAIGMTFAGGFGVVRRRRVLIEAASAGVFSAGAVGCVFMVGVAMVQPPPPAFSLSLAVTSRSDSPAFVTVCGRNLDGTPATVPGADRLIAIFIDGSQVDTGSSSRFAVKLAPGTHVLRAELLTHEHREFNPVVAATASVTVTGNLGRSNWSACPAR